MEEDGKDMSNVFLASRAWNGDHVEQLPFRAVKRLLHRTARPSDFFVVVKLLATFAWLAWETKLCSRSSWLRKYWQ